MHDDDPRMKSYREAYMIMAKEIGYRPQAPDDLTQEQLEDEALLDQKATEYALALIREEDATGGITISFSRPPTRAALLGIEAMRLLRADKPDDAVKYLEMALAELKGRH
jgi:hypothetical protein